jgi:hypothetical protein
MSRAGFRGLSMRTSSEADRLTAGAPPRPSGPQFTGPVAVAAAG